RLGRERAVSATVADEDPDQHDRHDQRDRHRHPGDDLVEVEDRAREIRARDQRRHGPVPRAAAEPERDDERAHRRHEAADRRATARHRALLPAAAQASAASASTSSVWRSSGMSAARPGTMLEAPGWTRTTPKLVTLTSLPRVTTCSRTRSA